MNNILRTTGVASVVILAVFSINTALANESQNKTQHDEHSHEHEKPIREAIDRHENAEGKEHKTKSLVKEKVREEGLSLSTQKIELAGIKIEQLFPQKYLNKVYAPGEVKVNGYKSYLVSPRTDSVVINRHASLGDHVKPGQKLVTLFSETMAQTQADFLIAASNWKRAKKLGSNNVSERSLDEAENIYKGVYGKLVAFGLTKQAIDKIAHQDSATFGQYVLTAKRDGVVLQDNFMQGQRIEAGETIMLLADETDLWVEANVAPNKELNLALGKSRLN